MGWVSALGRELGKIADAPPVQAALPDVQTAAVGGAIGGSLPADTAEERAQNVLLLGGGMAAARRLAPGQAADVQPSGFAGAQARTADLKQLEKAQAMEGAGLDPREIWQQTGWLKGEEGGWRFEINDEAARLRLEETPKVAWEFDLEEVFDHPELFAAYPELRGAQVVFKDLGPVARDSEGEIVQGSQGTYDKFFRSIVINNRLTREEAREAILHETQHTMQDIEGFAQGGMPEAGREFFQTEEIEQAFARLGDLKLRYDAAPDDTTRAAIRKDMDALKQQITEQAQIEAYLRLPGEVEARLVERRKDLTAGQRRAVFPDDMRDMAPETQAEPMGLAAAQDAPAPETPQQAARFETPGSPEYEAAVAKGLDMSTPARMARAKEMGFDTETVLYNGRGNDVSEFPEATFLTDDPKGADWYASERGKSPQIVPVYARIRNPFTLGDAASAQKLTEIARKAGVEATFTSDKGRGWSFEAKLTEGPNKFTDNPIDLVYDKRVRDALKAEGYDAVIDPYDALESGSIKAIVPLDPSNIRSVNAAFDPDKAKSSTLLASQTGGPLTRTERAEWQQAAAKGLDMSEPARMQRAEQQGFTIEAYRGIRVAPGAGELTDKQILGGAWFAETPETANTYAADVLMSRNKGFIMKARLKMENPLVVDADGAMFDRIAVGKLKGLIPDGLLEGKKHLTTQEVASLARAMGHDGVEFQNIRADRDSTARATPPGKIWAAFNPENVRSANAAFDPMVEGAPNLMSSQKGGPLAGKPRKVDTSVAGGLTEKSFIRTRDLEGATIFPMFADLTDAGSTFDALDGLPIAPTPYLGGPNFPWLKTYRENGIVWAFNKPGVITKVRNKVKALQKQARAEGRSGRIVITMLAMKDDAHTSNEMVISALLRTLDAVVEAGRFPQEQLDEAKRLIVSKAGKKDEGYSELATFPGFGDAQALHDWSRGATFAGRKALAKEMRSAKFQQLPGMFPVERIVREAIDPDYRATQQGDALLAFEIDPDAEDLIIDFDDPRSGNIPRHPAYRYGMRGELIGSFSTHIPMEVLYGDMLPKIVARAKKGANPKFLMERLKTGDGQVVTEDIIREAEIIEGLHDYRIAQAHTAGIAGQWRSSDVAANKGGVNPVEFERALLESDAAATLTKYTREDVTKGKKKGALRVFQLGDARVQDGGLNVWMAVKKGYDYRNEYPGEITDALVEQGILTDNEVALVGVASNELGVSGMATFQVLKGIEEGVTVLDAFKVTSPSKPNGLLPTIYATLGFEEVGQIPFDPKYYDAQQLADLKAIWTRQGWNEADGYPAVAIMKWRGDDAVRPEATRRFILESQAGLGIRGVADVEQFAAARGRVRRSDVAGDQGDGLPGQGDGRADPRRFADRARGVSDTVRSYVENILAADARAIKALKLPQELIDRIRAEYGPALAQRPDDMVGQAAEAPEAPMGGPTIPQITEGQT